MLDTFMRVMRAIFPGFFHYRETREERYQKRWAKQAAYAHRLYEETMDELARVKRSYLTQ